MDDGGWQTVAEARAVLQEAISNPTNATLYDLKDWDNYLVGGQIREEDSPGNYLLRETNNQLQLVIFTPDGGEDISEHLGFAAAALNLRAFPKNLDREPFCWHQVRL